MLKSPRRSVLYVPASNEAALAKVATRGADAVIIDLEDAVAPEAKAAARQVVEKFFAAKPDPAIEWVIRVNALASDWGEEDLALAARLEPAGILLPKIDTPRDLLEANDVLDDEGTADETRLWAMIETPRALLNIGAIAELGRDRGARLSCLVAGANDLAKDTGVQATPDRRYLLPWLMQLVLGARAGGLDVIDGVSNDFTDLEAFGRECAEAASMGFDGKTLIHPAQVEPANRAFSPSPQAVAEAEAIRAAFALPQNLAKGVISLDGRMVERLHLRQAEKLLARAGKAQGTKP